jgi:ubiquinone/menaquinone biosynthesis C-methylase UbiE
VGDRVIGASQALGCCRVWSLDCSEGWAAVFLLLYFRDQPGQGSLMVDVADSTSTAGHNYVLGHTQGELRRLAIQAALIDPITRRFVREGGITEGMRVLDIGSGGGHVAFLVADLVGSAGHVVGVDQSPTAVAAATADAQARSLGNVEFRAGNPAEMVFDRPFDAVVGRFVLQFQADPVSMLKNVARHVRPGGPVVFHELAWSGIWSFPPTPLHDRCCAWAMEAIRRSGTETLMGLKLYSTFVAAGLPEPTMRMEAVIAAGAQAWPMLEQVAGLVESLVPAMERFGVATVEEIGSESLLERLLDEARSAESVIFGRLQVGCWSRAGVLAGGSPDR